MKILYRVGHNQTSFDETDENIPFVECNGISDVFYDYYPKTDLMLEQIEKQKKKRMKEGIIDCYMRIDKSGKIVCDVPQLTLI